MRTSELYNSLYEMFDRSSLPFTRITWNKGRILCNIVEEEGEVLPDDLRERVADVLVGWVSDKLPDIPSDTVVDTLNGTPNGKPNGTPDFVRYCRHFGGVRLVIDLGLLREAERKCVVRKQGKKILEAALHTGSRFLSIRDIVFLTFNEFGESVSWRRACDIMELFEKEKVVRRNGQLRVNGREINRKGARKFLRKEKAGQG